MYFGYSTIRIFGSNQPVSISITFICLQEPDKLLVMGNTYKSIRDVLSELYLEGQMEGLQKVVGNACASPNEKIGQCNLLMALFKEVTTKFGSDRQPPPKVCSD